MECQDIRERLLDVLEGVAPVDQREAVEKHVKECSQCRAELEDLRRGLRGLTAYVQEVKQPRPHRETERLVRLLRAMERGRKRASLVTWRRVAIGAVLIALVAFGSFLYNRDVLLFRLLRSEPKPAGTVIVQVEPYVPGMQVVLTDAAGEGAQRVVSEYVKLDAPSSMPRAPSETERVILANSPGIYVPVRNVFYDSEETGYWW